MKPLSQSSGRQVAAAARALADALPGSAAVGRAAAKLAAACLELAEAPLDWIETHDLVRDAGVRPSREEFVGETARALVLTAECIRMLAVHGGLPGNLDGLPQRLAEFAQELGSSFGAMARIEAALADRLAEPRLAELGLEERRRRLTADPTVQIGRIRQLASDVDDLRQRDDNLRAREESLAAAYAELQMEMEVRLSRLDELGRGIEAMKGRIAERDDATRVVERERISLADNLRTADAVLARTREELEALRNDPRHAVRERVRAALLVLDSSSPDGRRSPGVAS